MKEFLEETEQQLDESGLLIFARTDHGPWMSLISQRMKGKLYLTGNPLNAEQMLKHALEVGLYVAVRIYEHEWGATRIDYDEVAPIIERLGNERVNEVA